MLYLITDHFPLFVVIAMGAFMAALLAVSIADNLAPPEGE